LHMRARRKLDAKRRGSAKARTPRAVAAAAAPPPAAPVAAAANHGGDPQWLVQIRSLYAVHNVVGTRAELPFWLIRSDGQRQFEWMELGEPNGNRPKPFHFEIYFGKESLRDEHY